MKNNNVITIDKLGDTLLSDLIESVIYDVQRVRKAGIRIDMDSWINQDACSVCLGGAALMGFLPDSYLCELPDNEEAVKIINNKKEKYLERMKSLFNDLRRKSTIYYDEVKNISSSDERMSSEVISQWNYIYPFDYNGLLSDNQLDRLSKELKILVKMLREKGC